MKIVWAIVLSLMDIAAFIGAGWLYYHDDVMRATFWMAMSISMEFAATRAWRRAKGLEGF